MKPEKKLTDREQNLYFIFSKQYGSYKQKRREINKSIKHSF